MMQVLHVHSGNLYGGVETLLTNLARHPYPEMKQHYALCFEGRLSDELRGAGAAIDVLGGTRISQPITVLRARKQLRELLRRERFDLAVCHSTWSQSLFGPVVRAAHLPLAFWLHNPTQGKYWLDRWGGLTVPDLMLCNSEFTAATSANLYRQVQSEVIYYPVAPPEVDYSPSERAATRAQFLTPPDAVVIIQASRMESWKGHALHLEALSMLKDLPSWICWQVGGAQRPAEIEYLDSLKRTAEQLGIADRVRFVGQRSDVKRLLAAADIHCQPNAEPEPFGIAFIEALYAQLPVVTISLGGACEIVNDTCGVLVAPSDARSLAESVRRLIMDAALRKRLGSAGPARARELCDVETQMQRLFEYFSNLGEKQVNNVAQAV